MKQKYGWVIGMKKNHPDGYSGFYSILHCKYSGPLKLAYICPTRDFARYIRDPHEVVRKVRLTKQGNIIKIITGR